MKIGPYNMSKGKVAATREVESKLEGKYFEYYFYDCTQQLITPLLLQLYMMGFHTILFMVAR